MAAHPNIRAIGLDHIVLLVSDVERSLQWYVNVLSLSPVRVDEWHSGDVYFPSVRINATTLIDLIPSNGQAVVTRNVDHFCVVIEPTDLDALAATGVFDVASGPTDGLFGAQGYATSLYVRDPDRNTIELRSYS